VEDGFLLDADALIKLNRAGILIAVLDATACAVPRAVYEEAVTNAKAKGYPDAEVIEAVLAGRCEVIEVVVPEALGLGRGEAGLLALAETGQSGLVVSDDERFQSVLQSRHIPFLNCARLVTWLAEQRVLTSVAASAALQALWRYISAESFEFAEQVLTTMSGDRHEED
jgi:hypothetical protein